MDPIKSKIEEVIDNFKHADKRKAHAKAKKTGGCWDKGQGSDFLITADLCVDRILDEHFQDENVGPCVVGHKVDKLRPSGNSKTCFGVNSDFKRVLIIVLVYTATVKQETTGIDCGKVGREVASNIRGALFKSKSSVNFHFTVNCIERTKIGKVKRGRAWQKPKVSPPNQHYKTYWQSYTKVVGNIPIISNCANLVK